MSIKEKKNPFFLFISVPQLILPKKIIVRKTFGDNFLCRDM